MAEIDMIDVVVEGEIIKQPSALLMMSSPVFHAMLSSSMQEGTRRQIDLEGKSKKEFEAVLRFMHPVTCRTEKITNENVDFLLKWFDEYGMATLKDECEEFLTRQPCSVDRLLQAHKFSLSKQYERCLEFVGRNFEDLPIQEVVEDSPDMMHELLTAMQAGSKKRRAETQALKEGLEKIPMALCNVLPSDQLNLGGSRQRLDEFVKATAQKLLKPAIARLER